MCGMGIEPRLFSIISIISSSRRLSEEASPTRAADDEEPYTPVFLNANSVVECNTTEQLSGLSNCMDIRDNTSLLSMIPSANSKFCHKCAIAPSQWNKTANIGDYKTKWI